MPLLGAEDVEKQTVPLPSSSAYGLPMVGLYGKQDLRLDGLL